MIETNLRPYTIRLFVPDGDPNSFKIIDKMNWTGIGLEVARDTWSKQKKRKEFEQAGVYILVGNDEETELPILYIGQGDGVKGRIDSHIKNKLFWDKVLVFISSNDGLNRAHITWIEWALIKRATEIGRCKLDNNTFPTESVLTEYEKADTTEFLNEILSVLPIVDVKVFNKGRKIEVQQNSNIQISEQNTVIVPANEEGFKDVFLGEDCWHAIRIGGGKLKEIKYIAAYQTAPISAITYYAEVDSIEAYGDGGKYKLNFKGKANKIEPIKLGNAKPGSLQGPRYANLQEMLKSKTIKELFEKE